MDNLYNKRIRNLGLLFLLWTEILFHLQGRSCFTYYISFATPTREEENKY